MTLRQYEQKYDECLSTEDVFTDLAEKAKVRLYLERSRSDLFFARLQMKISTESKAKQSLMIDASYTCFPWVIVAGYYAMYQAATAAIAQKGLKARSHVATVAALAKHYALGSKLAQQLDEMYITQLDATRVTRTLAQYEVTKSFGQMESQRVIDTAQEFIDLISEIITK